MTKRLRLILTLIVLSFALSPSVVLAQVPEPGNTISGDQVIIGNTFTLESGETLDGNLLIIGGTASTAVDSEVTGDILLIGGTLSVNGSVIGDIVSIGGFVKLEDEAVVNGRLTTVGASLARSPLAQINGGISEETLDGLDFSSLDDQLLIPSIPQRSPLARILTAAIESLALAALAVLVGLLLPKKMKNAAAELVERPMVTGGIGLLTVVVAPVILVLLAITIILLPVSLLAALSLALMSLFGFIIVGYEVGVRFSALFKDIWHPSISAGVGTLILSLVTGIAAVIPCVGWVLGFIATVMGLGAVITSRFGSDRRPPNSTQDMISPAEQAPPQSPPQEPPAPRTD